MLILVGRLLAAASSPIPDCDEVFNFWEPTHFVTHGSGLQTWEWSPVYAIRSWAYVYLHALLLTPFGGLSQKHQFYVLRSLFAVFEAYTEYKLATALKKYNPKAAHTFTLLSFTCTGLFHASVAYLPSSFGMYFVTLATAAFLESPSNIVQCLVYIGIGGILGWPFVLLLALPFGLYYTASIGSFSRWISSVLRTLTALTAILGAVVAVDSYFFQKLVVVPFNIVAYNVLFASEDAGPEIFGVEPWYYYAVNLLLNFNVLLPLAAAMPLFERNKPVVAVWTTCALWLGVLNFQPHKEERFIYPIYPLLALCASVTIARVWLVATKLVKLPNVVYKLGVASIGILSLLRTLALVSYYGAPLQIYDEIEPNSIVCYGREWYRFPSSYFLEGSQPRFIKSGFDGLLPGVFESQSAVPSGMNNKNQFDEGKLVDLDTCDYIVEMDVLLDEAKGEFKPRAGWTKQSCREFLDVENTPTLTRLLFNPNAKKVDYCLYKRM